MHFVMADPKVVFEFGGGGDRILLDDIQCYGNEANLLQCFHNGIEMHNCFQYEHAGVSCGNHPLSFFFVIVFICHC